MSDTFKCPICGETKEWGENSHMILISHNPAVHTVCENCAIVAERLNQAFMDSEAGIRADIRHVESGIRLTREQLHKYVGRLGVLREKLRRKEEGEA